jgi:endonuclease/exonuclease/phosphatase (EEP) superfamily protein YafD
MARRGAERRRRARGRAATALEVAAGLLVAAWLAGQLARDATLPTALLFYLPSLLVALVLLLLAGSALAARGRALAILLAALPPFVVGVAVEHRWHRPATESRAVGSPLRLLHWNVSGGWAGLDEIAREIARRHPDLVVLSEAPERVARRVSEELPELDARTLDALSVFAVGVGEPEWVERSRELQLVAVTLPWRGRRLRLLAANLASSPLIPRQPSLARVRAAIVALEPDLVVGDFNAPRRSRVLSRLPAGYRHAYEVAGSGWSASWPEPLPLLSLDHVIVGRAIGVQAYALESVGWSDHRLQLAELDVAAP